MAACNQATHLKARHKADSYAMYVSAPHTPRRHSARNATAGSTLAARLAGPRHAAMPTPAVLLPFEQSGIPFATLLVRTSSDPTPLRRAIIKAIQAVAPRQPLGAVTTLEEIRDETLGPRRLNALFVTSFAGLAFLIAMVGVVGVLAASVRSRTNEFGIRMSLGAGPERLRRLVLGEGGLLIVLGIGVGLAGSFFAAR